MLAPGATLTISDVSYMPSAPDQGPISGTTDKYDPGTAMFSDTVTVTGEGFLSGAPLDPAPFASVTCDLCP
jgi:hypothetical protein